MDVTRQKRVEPSRRSAILVEAMRLFAEHGVHVVSTRQIAAAVGISQPSLYAHFATRQALIEEVCATAFGALRENLAAVEGTLGVAEELDELARIYVAFGLAQPDAYRVAFMLESGQGATTQGASDGMLQAGMQAFGILRAAVARRFPQRDAYEVERLAQSLWAHLHGLVALLIARPGFPWVARDALIAEHLAGFGLIVAAA